MNNGPALDLVFRLTYPGSREDFCRWLHKADDLVTSINVGPCRHEYSQAAKGRVARQRFQQLIRPNPIIAREFVHVSMGEAFEVREIIGCGKLQPGESELWPEPQSLPDLLPSVAQFDSAMLPERVRPFVDPTE